MVAAKPHPLASKPLPIMSEAATQPAFADRLYNGIMRRLFGTVTKVITSESIAALTFDDGPHPEYTPRLLEVLERHDAKATFFMLGKHAAAHPRLVERIAQAGHALANHTFDHVRMPETPRRERLRQLRRCRAALAPHGVGLFRPPFGGQSLGSRIDAMLAGYDVVTWSMHAEDWAGHNSATMVGRLERQLKPGSIILLHDMLDNPRVAVAADRGPTIAAIDTFLTHVGTRYRFITVPELMRRGRPVRASWFKPAQ